MNTEKEIRITLTLNEEERIELMDIPEMKKPWSYCITQSES